MAREDRETDKLEEIFLQLEQLQKVKDTLFCNLELNLLAIRKDKKTGEKRSMIKKDGFFS